MTTMELIFEGKEKLVYSTDRQDKVLIRYKDDTTAFANVKRAIIKGKGEVNCTIASILFKYLNDNGIPTHFVSMESPCEMLCRKVDIIPMEIIVRNCAAGSMAERLGLEEGAELPNVVVDLGYSCDSLENPMINADEARALGLATLDELHQMREITLRANDLLRELFAGVGIRLADLKLEFGRSADDGSIIIADEISPDTCRLWDMQTGEKLDKDRFRHDLGNVLGAYKKVLEKLQTL